MESADLLFRVANAVAAIGWIALALSPATARWAPAVRRVTGRFLPLGFALVYVVLMATHLGADGGFGSIAEVQRLFAVPELLVAGWLHYLAFDLFVGSWIAGRAAALRIPHAIVIGLLLLTFMFGPAGLLAYAALRATLYRERTTTPRATLA
ncbi:MAG: ABA4-like family protein [Burkholderiaceae bacterium]